MPAPNTTPFSPTQFGDWASFFGGNVQAPQAPPPSAFGVGQLGQPPANGQYTGGWAYPDAWANFYEGKGGFQAPQSAQGPSGALAATYYAFNTGNPNDPNLLGWEKAYGNPQTILQNDQNWAQSLGSAPTGTPSNELTGGWQNPAAWAAFYGGTQGFTAPENAGSPASALAAAAQIAKTSSPENNPALLGWVQDFGQPGSVLANMPNWAASLGSPQINTQGQGFGQTNTQGWDSPLAWAAFYGGFQGFNEGQPQFNTLEAAQNWAGVTNANDPSLLGWELDYGNPQTVVSTIQASQAYQDYLAALQQQQQPTVTVTQEYIDQQNAAINAQNQQIAAYNQQIQQQIQQQNAYIANLTQQEQALQARIAQLQHTDPTGANAYISQLQGIQSLLGQTQTQLNALSGSSLQQIQPYSYSVGQTAPGFIQSTPLPQPTAPIQQRATLVPGTDISSFVTKGADGSKIDVRSDGSIYINGQLSVAPVKAHVSGGIGGTLGGGGPFPQNTGQVLTPTGYEPANLFPTGDYLSGLEANAPLDIQNLVIKIITSAYGNPQQAEFGNVFASGDTLLSGLDNAVANTVGAAFNALPSFNPAYNRDLADAISSVLTGAQQGLVPDLSAPGGGTFAQYQQDIPTWDLSEFTRSDLGGQANQSENPWGALPDFGGMEQTVQQALANLGTGWTPPEVTPAEQQPFSLPDFGGLTPQMWTPPEAPQEQPGTFLGNILSGLGNLGASFNPNTPETSGINPNVSIDQVAGVAQQYLPDLAIPGGTGGEFGGPPSFEIPTVQPTEQPSSIGALTDPWAAAYGVQSEPYAPPQDVWAAAYGGQPSQPPETAAATPPSVYSEDQKLHKAQELIDKTKGMTMAQLGRAFGLPHDERTPAAVDAYKIDLNNLPKAAADIWQMLPSGASVAGYSEASILQMLQQTYATILSKAGVSNADIQTARGAVPWDISGLPTYSPPEQPQAPPAGFERPPADIPGAIQYAGQEGAVPYMGFGSPAATAAQPFNPPDYGGFNGMPAGYSYIPGLFGDNPDPYNLTAPFKGESTFSNDVTFTPVLDKPRNWQDWTQQPVEKDWAPIGGEPTFASSYNPLAEQLGLYGDWSNPPLDAQVTGIPGRQSEDLFQQLGSIGAHADWNKFAADLAPPVTGDPWASAYGGQPPIGGETVGPSPLQPADVPFIGPQVPTTPMIGDQGVVQTPPDMFAQGSPFAGAPGEDLSYTPGTLGFLHGMESRYGKYGGSVAQVEADAQAIAEQMGLNFRVLGGSGDDVNAQIAAGKDYLANNYDISQLLGFSAGGTSADALAKMYGIPDITVATGAGGQGGFYAPGASHMQQLGMYGDYLSDLGGAGFGPSQLGQGQPSTPATDYSYLEQYGGHATDLTGLNTNIGAEMGYNSDFAARLEAAGRAYQAATGKDPVYGEADRGPDIQDIYYQAYQLAKRGLPIPEEWKALYDLESGASPPSGGIAAAPGTSRHQSGQAMDLPSSEFRDWLKAGNAAQFGIGFPVPGDAPHSEPIPNWQGQLPQQQVIPTDQSGLNQGVTFDQVVRSGQPQPFIGGQGSAFDLGQGYGGGDITGASFPHQAQPTDPQLLQQLSGLSQGLNPLWSDTQEAQQQATDNTMINTILSRGLNWSYPQFTQAIAGLLQPYLAPSGTEGMGAFSGPPTIEPNAGAITRGPGDVGPVLPWLANQISSYLYPPAPTVDQVAAGAGLTEPTFANLTPQQLEPTFANMPTLAGAEPTFANQAYNIPADVFAAAGMPYQGGPAAGAPSANKTLTPYSYPQQSPVFASGSLEPGQIYSPTQTTFFGSTPTYIDPQNRQQFDLGINPTKTAGISSYAGGVSLPERGHYGDMVLVTAPNGEQSWQPVVDIGPRLQIPGSSGATLDLLTATANAMGYPQTGRAGSNAPDTGWQFKISTPGAWVGPPPVGGYPIPGAPQPPAMPVLRLIP